MRSSIPILSGLVALVSTRCGTAPPSENMKALHAGYQAKAAGAAKGPAPRQILTFDIDTYVHIIQSDDGSEGYVPESQIDDQVSAIQGVYYPHFGLHVYFLLRGLGIANCDRLLFSMRSTNLLAFLSISYL